MQNDLRYTQVTSKYELMLSIFLPINRLKGRHRAFQLRAFKWFKENN
jgi:hypothetical protein